MFCRCLREGRITISIIVITVAIFGKFTWSTPHAAQILFLEEPVNASFDSFEDHYSAEGFTINTVGCVIPAISIKDESIRKYINDSKNLTSPCKNYEHRLLENNQTHIWTIQENFRYYNINNKSSFECCYKPFYRPRSLQARGVISKRIEYLGCIMFEKIIEVNNEFVKVSCFYDAKVIYDQYFIFTPKKPFTINRAIPFKAPVNQTEYNIIIMGLGSMSRQNFYRTMPNTLGFLKKHNVVELKGYNTLASDTFLNLVPVLVGMNVTELDTTCWPTTKSTFDSCPFIWERFKDVGYYTALVEDTARFGMFNLGKVGFRGVPTDYYLHPFMHETEKVSYKSKMSTRLSRIRKLRRLIKFAMEERNQTMQHIRSVCMGDKYYFEVLLNYVESLTKTLSSSKLFGLFWETSMSHDNLNDPLKMDNAYVTLIKKFESSGYLNETIIIFLSDHGMNKGEIKLTKQGRIEQRLPFVFILMPPSFRKKYKLAYYNLKVNKGRLSTPYDVHKTLVDLIDLSDLTQEEILKRSREFYTHERGISLFLQIPRNRTCEMAGINNEWCACYNYINVRHDSPILLEAIKFLTFQINELLASHPECLKLIVDEIVVAKEMLPTYEKNVEWRDFNIIVRMAPGGGIFEAMIRHNKNRWTIIDHVKRLNFPGFRSLCVEDDNLKLFCYCK